jgi:hypothetical protein
MTFLDSIALAVCVTGKPCLNCIINEVTRQKHGMS